MELSNKESKAKQAEAVFRQKAQALRGYTEDSPVQNLRDPSKWKKSQPQP